MQRCPPGATAHQKLRAENGVDIRVLPEVLAGAGCVVDALGHKNGAWNVIRQKVYVGLGRGPVDPQRAALHRQ